MAGYLVRIALPDRPGALGLVASRIGAVGGDIVAIHILERVDGNAVDEFVIELGGEHLVELLRSEIHEVDGAEVVDISAVPATASVPERSSAIYASPRPGSMPRYRRTRGRQSIERWATRSIHRGRPGQARRG